MTSSRSGVALPPLPPAPHIPPAPPLPHLPGAFPLHQPPPPEEFGPHRSREAGAYDDEAEDDQDFNDIADKLSLSSVSTSSSDSDFSTLADEDTEHDNESPDVIFARKTAYIENLAVAARASHQQSTQQIEEERTKALSTLQRDHERAISRREYRAQKRELRKEVRAWKRGVKSEFRNVKGMDKQQRREWKQARKADWRGLKEKMKEEFHARGEAPIIEHLGGLVLGW